MIVKVACFSCSENLQFTDRIGLRDECTRCRADVHVCRNCQHFEAGAYNDCREPVAEFVREKDRANFCDFFTPRTGQAAAAQGQKDLRSAADALFKKKP